MNNLDAFNECVFSRFRFGRNDFEFRLFSSLITKIINDNPYTIVFPDEFPHRLTHSSTELQFVIKPITSVYMVEFTLGIISNTQHIPVEYHELSTLVDIRVDDPIKQQRALNLLDSINAMYVNPINPFSWMLRFDETAPAITNHQYVIDFMETISKFFEFSQSVADHSTITQPHIQLATSHGVCQRAQRGK